MSEPLELVAFDIETTGLTVDDEVTVVGFVLPIGCRVFCQTGDHDEAGVGEVETTIKTDVEARVEPAVGLSVHPSETELLEAVSDCLRQWVCDAEYLLVAYNGEVWNGGFDLPFLRTRFARQGLSWPFEDVPYADLLPIYQDLFNTTRDGESPADLVTMYELFGTGSCGAPDPFEESHAAVEAFADGRVADVVSHNVADILRTQHLGELAQRYCSKSDFDLKSLSPTVGGVMDGR
jgi:hypothetical protein